MCVADWRLGRLISTKFTTLPMVGGGTGVILPNTSRVGITFGLGRQNAAFEIEISVSGVVFLVLANFYPIHHMTIADYGDLPTKQFNLTNTDAVNDNPIGVVEYFMPERYLAAALKSFDSEYGLAGY